MDKVIAKLHKLQALAEEVLHELPEDLRDDFHEEVIKGIEAPVITIAMWQTEEAEG